MFNINNKAVIRKITNRALRSDRRRNFFIAAAIALTAFMITSVFSVGISYYETLQITPFRSEGIFAHAVFMNPTPEQMGKLNSLNSDLYRRRGKSGNGV